MKIRKYLLAATAVLLFGTAKADEGMWLLQLMKQQNSIELMHQRGLKLSADALYNPNGISLKDAVGIFGRGCTGEIISPEGLILTNHHCGYSSIQQHSSVEHDYLTDGFWAKNRNEELPTPGLTFKFVDKIVDITDLVNSIVKEGKATETETFTQPFLQKVAKAEYEKSEYKGKPGIEFKALPFYAGNKFYLFYYKVYSDVRMVAAPPSSVGKFGGETDNWMWPRHTGDFSMFRIYADKNGNPAKYSKENVPLKTPQYLHVSIKGENEGDYAMVMGFPGSTSRYLTEAEVKMRMYAENEPRIDIRGARLAVLKKMMAESDKIRIQYADKFAGSSNYWKNSIGMNKALIDNHVLEAKAEIEKRFNEFAKGKPEYQGVTEKLDKMTAAMEPVRKEYMYLVEVLQAVEFATPYTLTDQIKEALKKKDKAALEASLAKLKLVYTMIHNKDFDMNVDRAVAKAVYPVYAEKIPAEQRPDFYQIIEKKFKGNTDAFIDAMYDNSILANEKNLEKFLKKPTVKAIDNDLNIAYTRSIFEKYQQLAGELSKFKPESDLLHKSYIRGLGEMKLPTPSYPDANFTIRLTYGSVKGYQPKDGVHFDYYTTAEGVLQKNNPNDREFAIPAKLKELIENKDFGPYTMADGTMPVCFLTTNDITGGNSGSPVMNAEGQLIGTAFDGNWESLSGDINFDNKLQRCIVLDIRYVLFILDKLGGCKHLIDEMTIVK